MTTIAPPLTPEQIEAESYWQRYEDRAYYHYLLSWYKLPARSLAKQETLKEQRRSKTKETA